MFTFKNSDTKSDVLIVIIMIPMYILGCLLVRCVGKKGESSVFRPPLQRLYTKTLMLESNLGGFSLNRNESDLTPEITDSEESSQSLEITNGFVQLQTPLQTPLTLEGLAPAFLGTPMSPLRMLDSLSKASSTLSNIEQAKLGRTLSLYDRTSTLYYRASEWFTETVANQMIFFIHAWLNVLDTVSDCVMLARYWQDSETKILAYISLTIMVGHRIISAMVLGDKFGWSAGVRQLFDIEIFVVMWNSIDYKRAMFEMRENKVLHGVLQNFPQLLVQTYQWTETSETSDPFRWISIVLSLLSLSRCYFYSDFTSIHEKGLSFGETQNFLNGAASTASQIVCIVLLQTWRFGGISMKVSIIVVFLKIVCDRNPEGMVAFFIMFVVMYCLKRKWMQNEKASIFYRKREKPKKVREIIKKGGQSGRKSKLEWLLFDPEPRSKSTLCALFLVKLLKAISRLLIVQILWIVELFYYFIALPTLYPGSFVIVYYVIRFIFEYVLLYWCTQIRISESGNGWKLWDIISNEVFGDLFVFYAVGCCCFFFGGIAVLLFVVDVEQYKNSHEADPAFLLKMIEQKNFTFIERVVKNGECSAYDVVQKALACMKDRNINCKDNRAMKEFHKQEPFSKLIYYMIKEKLVEIGPSDRRITPRDVKKPRFYKSYAVAALLYKCNGSRKKSNESEFAKIVLSKLVTLRRFDDGLKRLVPYSDIREAGASLVFLRYHLDLSEEMFRKNGELRCTARQLYEENFDMLFCLRAGFDVNELSLAGFDDWLLKDENVQRKNDNGNWLDEVDHLRVLKKAGFQSNFYYMNFTLFSLRESGVFTSQELIKLREIFECHKEMDECSDCLDCISDDDSTEVYNIADEDCSSYGDVSLAINKVVVGGQLLQPQISMQKGNTSFVNFRTRGPFSMVDQLASDFSSCCEGNEVSRSQVEQSSPSSCSELLIKVPNPRPTLVSKNTILQKRKSPSNLLRVCSKNTDPPNIMIQTPWSSTRDCYRNKREELFKKGLQRNSKFPSRSILSIRRETSSPESISRVVYNDTQSSNPPACAPSGLSQVSIEDLISLDSTWESSCHKISSESIQ